MVAPPLSPEGDDKAGARTRAVPRRRLGLGLAAAVLGPVLVTLLAIDESITQVIPGRLYLFVVAAAAAVGGTGPGLVAGALSLVLLDYFFIVPRESFDFASVEDFLALVVFALVAVGVSQLVARIQSLRREAEAAVEQARRLQGKEEALRERVSFLAEASDLLFSSLDYEQTLAQMARLAVPRLADWCAIDMVGPGGSIARLAVAHQDPEKIEWARRLQTRYPPEPDAPRGVPQVLRTGKPDVIRKIPDELLVEVAEGDEEFLTIIRELGLRSSIVVPLIARGRTLGALTLIAAESGRLYDEVDLELAQELARRAAIAVDNARLFREAERRGHAAEALEYVDDAVVLLDEGGAVRYWNPAAENLTGVPEAGVLGRPALDVVPGWGEIAARVEPGSILDESPSRPATMPSPFAEGERWLSVSGVDFGEGVVYALRDVTEEHALERARSDFVSTASHELRTPLAAVYGAARTLRREDLELSPAEQESFLAMIETEAERLSRIVSQILLAGQLDAGEVQLAEGLADAVSVVRGVLESASFALPESVSMSFDPPDSFPRLACDENQLRQVLVNLVDNAIKYSPDGGSVEVRLAATDSNARIEVADRGLGVPVEERDRIFEKFYRLDPGLRRGVGGTGLGLYISHELVERMGGRIGVEARDDGDGSTFFVELPVGGP